MPRVLAASSLITLLFACGGESSNPDASQPHLDAESVDAGAEDARVDDGGIRDAALPDAGFADAQAPSLGDRVELSLSDSTVIGELAYVYDQRRWWMSEDEQTWLVFVASALASYPNDRSFRFVDRSSINDIEILPSVGPTYRDVLREEGLFVERSPLDGVAQVVTGHEGYHLEEDGRGDFAWDLVVTSSSTGLRWTGDGFDNEDYFVFDRPVYLPTGGTVVEVVRDAPDNIPGDYPPDAINNLVGVHIGGQYYVYVLHFRAGTIPVEIEPGALLTTGAYLGRAGNSGISLEPHVHLTMLYFDEITGRTWSVPSELANIYSSQTSVGGQLQSFAVPETGDWISSAPF